MRGLRSTLALLAVLIGLGAYIYYDSRREPAPTDQKEEVFASLEAADITELHIRSESDERTVLRKEGDDWRIVKPISAPASGAEVTGVNAALAGLEVQRVIDEQPSELSPYGLATPRFEVEFKSVEGKPSGRLLVGAKTPTGGELYAKRNDEPRVFLIPSYQESALNRATFDLRDKSVLTFERDQIDGIEVATGGSSFAFAKADNDWKVTRPLQTRADFGSVEALLGRIETAQMKAVADDNPTPEELRKYGLDRPAVTVTLNAGSSKAVLQVGGAAGEDAVYARDASRAEVVTIENTLADDLKRTLEDYRRKDVFDFRAYTATRAEITRGDQTLVLERVPGQDDAPDTWRRVSPNAGDADKGKVETLLTGLADIRAVSFTETTAKTGLDKPVLTVFVKFEDGKREERISFGRVGADAYASIPGESGAAKIDGSKLDDALKTFDELLK